ncbi:MAG: alpha/beta hydrolase [Motiliproteus sp.]
MTILNTSDGTDLHYLTRDAENPSGATVIFLHGWCSNALEWLPFAESLPQQQRAICWNARGHGSAKITEEAPVSLQRMAEDLHELIAKEAPQGAVVVAHSMGALTVWRYIQSYGCEQIKGLVIIDQSPKLLTDDQWQHGVFGKFEQADNQQFCQQLDHDFADAVIRLICGRLKDASDSLPDSKYFQRLREYLGLLPGPKLTECWQSLCDADLRSVMAMITSPTLLLYGDRSQFYGPELAGWVHRQINGSQLIRYSEADHSPHIAERERFISDLNSFTNQISGNLNIQPESLAIG